MKLLLTTLHAKYAHSSLALPSLAAHCQSLPEVSISIREWTVHDPREYLLRLIMAEQADLVAFSCYIWNIEQTLKIASDIKKLAPKTVIVLGGPEVSFGIFDCMQLHHSIDYIIKGEGEVPFRALLSELIQPDSSGRSERLARIDNLFYRDEGDITSGPVNGSYVELDTLPSPFAAGLVDMAKPLTYYETSRGCPFSCAFCLSSVEESVRSFSMERIEQDLLLLMQLEVPQIKLVDRTFNYDARRANQIWNFILQHNRTSRFHFEIAADLLTDDNMELLCCVPDNCFHFEIGVQSTSAATLERVGRRADLSRIFAAVARLKKETKIEIHLDLVAGLPGEDYSGFLDSLQMVAQARPDMLQVEPLKVLKGAPMRTIAAREQYLFSDAPPYTILGNPWLDFTDICRIETIGRLLDLIAKNGHFKATFRTVEYHLRFAHILDQMARQVGNDNLSSLSSRRVFELVARLAGPLLPAEQQPLLCDALFYDYCHMEMPMMGKLPAFVADRQQHCSWPGRTELPNEVLVPDGSRVKSFRYTFATDFREGTARSGPTTVTFAYISLAGKGLRIVVR